MSQALILSRRKPHFFQNFSRQEGREDPLHEECSTCIYSLLYVYVYILIFTPYIDSFKLVQRFREVFYGLLYFISGIVTMQSLHTEKIWIFIHFFTVHAVQKKMQNKIRIYSIQHFCSKPRALPTKLRKSLNSMGIENSW